MPKKNPASPEVLNAKEKQTRIPPSVPGGRSSSSTGDPRGFWRGAVEEVPDEDSVIVGGRNYLELVKLEAEYSAGMFLEQIGGNEDSGNGNSF